MAGTANTANVNSGGTLAVGGGFSPLVVGIVNVNSGGTLTGTGTINGAVNVLSGGNLNPGGLSAPGTLTVGNLVLNGGSLSNFRLATPGNGSDLVNVTGNLSLGGTLNVTQFGGVRRGHLRSFQLHRSADEQHAGLGNVAGGV